MAKRKFSVTKESYTALDKSISSYLNKLEFLELNTDAIVGRESPVNFKTVGNISGFCDMIGSDSCPLCKYNKTLWDGSESICKNCPIYLYNDSDHGCNGSPYLKYSDCIEELDSIYVWHSITSEAGIRNAIRDAIENCSKMIDFLFKVRDTSIPPDDFDWWNTINQEGDQ